MLGGPVGRIADSEVFGIDRVRIGRRNDRRRGEDATHRQDRIGHRHEIDQRDESGVSEPALNDVGKPADPVNDHRREPGGEELERHRATHGHGTTCLGHQASRLPGHDLHRAPPCACDHLPDNLGVAVMEDGHDEPGARHPAGDSFSSP